MKYYFQIICLFIFLLYIIAYILMETIKQGKNSKVNSSNNQIIFWMKAAVIQNNLSKGQDNIFVHFLPI